MSLRLCGAQNARVTARRRNAHGRSMHHDSMIVRAPLFQCRGFLFHLLKGYATGPYNNSQRGSRLGSLYYDTITTLTTCPRRSRVALLRGFSCVLKPLTIFGPQLCTMITVYGNSTLGMLVETLVET